jgi:lysophospholipase L1-like esterase
MVKPYKILILILLVNVMLGAFIMLFPKGDIQLTDNLKLHFISVDDLLHPKTVSHVDINKIVSNVSDSLLQKQRNAGGNINDSIVLKEDPQKLSGITYKIQYADDNRDALKNLFVSLDSIETHKKLIRILHYGDSQIEGDRISSTLREMLQLKFGGCGTGIIPVYEPNAMRNTIQINPSANWIKYAIYGGLYKNFDTKKYGILGSVFRYYAKQDSSHPQQQVKAVVSLKKLFSAYPHAKKYEQLSLYYGNSGFPSNILLHLNDKVQSTTLDKNSGFAVKSWALPNNISNVEFDFLNEYGPDIYGVSLDGLQGVSVDNVPMRGSSGTDFGRLDMNYLSGQINQSGARLIIFEYGVNVVPYVIGNYDFYEKQFYKQLKHFKDKNPRMSMLVIGVSDMSKKEGTNYVSYPNIEMIRDAQKRAAFRAGCAYWDMYEAMGGKNSMVSWVEAKPDALAEKDYTHFNYRGARIIGEMIYNALMNEYYAYKRGNRGV